MGFGKDGKGVIIRETALITLLTLGDVTALKGTQAVAITDDFRIIKTEVRAFLTSISAGEGFGFSLYLVNDDLTAQQISNAIVNDGPINSSDRDKIEASNRFLKLFGMSDTTMQAAGTVIPFKGRENQEMLSETVRWSFNKGVGWNWAIFNNSGSALTTGGLVKIIATHYGVWI